MKKNILVTVIVVLGFLFCNAQSGTFNQLKIGGRTITTIATDTTLSGNSDASLPTQKAVKKYVDKLKTYVQAKDDYGAKADGSTNDSAALVNLINANIDVDLGGLTYKFTGSYITPANRKIKNGTIIFGSDASFIRFGAGCIVENINFVGTLTSKQQFVHTYNGVASYFASPTYQDYAGTTISGSDFTKSLTGNILSINLPSGLTGALARQVVSSNITLNYNKRYIITIDDNFITGNGVGSMSFVKTDASGNELATYMQHDDTKTQLYLDSASYLKIKIANARHDHTKLNLTATYDLSKIHIYELVNDLGSVNKTWNLEAGTNVSIYADSVTVQNCTFTMMKFAALKVVTGNYNKVVNNTVKWCIGGFTTQQAKSNTVSNNNIDLNFKDDAGALIPSAFAIRNHGISASQETDDVYIGNYINGASWAIELPPYGNLSRNTVASNNTINAVYCGISMASVNATVDGNIINLTPLGGVGIELPFSDSASVTNNAVRIAASPLNNYGIAGSGSGLEGVVIRGNYVKANTGIHFAAPVVTGKNIIINGNTIDYRNDGIYTNIGLNITNNQFKSYNRFSQNGLAPTSAFNLQTSFYAVNAYNNVVDGAGAYCVIVTTPQLTDISNNTFNSFTGNYTDIYTTGTTSFNQSPKYTNNVIVMPTSTPFALQGSTNAGSAFKFYGNISNPSGNVSLINTMQNLPTTNLALLQNNISNVSKIVGAGSTPTISNGTITSRSTDIAGVITFTTTGSAGSQTVVTFNTAYSVAPIVTLTAAASQANFNPYVTATTTGFTVFFRDTPTGGSSYSFNYQVVQ